MKKEVYCVIMAGGQGSRFWPMSRTHRPKQFIDIIGNGSTMIQETELRFEAIIPSDNFFVVTGERYEPTVLVQLPALHPDQVLTEPAPRNTAPAIAYAAYKIYSQNPDAVMVVTPSDHFVQDQKSFNIALHKAIEFAEQKGHLVTIGIKPTFPATAYGYIETGDEIPDSELRAVKRFKEKPELEEAEKLVADGHHLWNSGMFVWHVQDIIDALELHLPEVAVHFAELHKIYGTASETAEVAKAFLAAPSISIDYGVMEKATNVVTLKGDFGWTDLGTWSSLQRFLKETGKKERDGIHLEHSPRTLIRTSDPKKKVVAVGLEDYLVVDMEDILLIAPKTDEKALHNYLDKYADLCQLPED